MTFVQDVFFLISKRVYAGSTVNEGKADLSKDRAITLPISSEVRSGRSRLAEFPRLSRLVSVFLLESPFVGVRPMAGLSRTLTASSTEADRRISPLFCRLQSGRLSRRPLSGRSSRSRGPGVLTLQLLQISGGGRGRRCRSHLAGGRALRGLFGGVRRLSLGCVVLLRQSTHADPRECDRNCQ